MKLVEIFVLVVVALVLVGPAHAARGAKADSLDMLGNQCAGPTVGSEAEETFQAFDDEARKIKCRDLGSWSFDIDALPERLQSIFNSTAPFTPKQLEELELELLKQADPTAYKYVLRLMRRANELVAKGQPNRASSLLRGFAGCVKAEGLTDLVIADKGPYKSPLGTVELPLFPGLTVKPGWPHSEVYIGNASLYAKGGPFEGYEPVLMSTKILATTGVTMASVASPILGRAMGYAAACASTERIVKTVSAPLFARYYAHVEMDLSMEEFDKYFEEEVIKSGTIPGVPGAYSVTYRLRNKVTGEVYEKKYNAGHVLQVVTVVAAAVKGVKEAAKGGNSQNTSDELIEELQDGSKGGNARCGGTLTADEREALQKIADKHQAQIDVVGSRAAGKGRNINSKLPVGKGAGTRSDIDVKLDGQDVIDSKGLLADDLLNMGKDVKFGNDEKLVQLMTKNKRSYPPVIEIKPRKRY